jgi:hypothetical protein
LFFGGLYDSSAIEQGWSLGLLGLFLSSQSASQIYGKKKKKKT